MLITLDREADLPLYRQLSDQIRTYIRDGVLSAESQLPTVRELAKSLGLTRLTVQTAYAELQAEGLVISFVGRGTFVADTPPLAIRATFPRPNVEPPPIWYSQNLFADMLLLHQQPNLISFAQAAPDPGVYPMRELSAALRKAALETTTFDYGLAQGEAVLREEVAHLLLDRGIVATPDTVLITSGAQQAIDLGLRAFTAPEEVLVVEEPTFPGLIELATQRRQRVLGVPIDQDGMKVEHLEEVCKLYRPRLVYTIPTFHNPTGVSLSAERKERLLRLATVYDFLILEDDVYGFLGFGGPGPSPLKALDKENRVIYLTSFSKICAPGLRLGAMVAHEEQLAKLLTIKRASDLGNAPLQQRGLAEYLRRRHFPGHLQRVRGFYQQRLEVMLGALHRHLPQCEWHVPQGGLCVWLKLPEGINERDFYLAAIERGVGITPGRAFFPHPSPAAHFRLGFACHEREQIEQGVAILGRLLTDHLLRQAFVAARAGQSLVALV